jgi:hypothetical protein
LFPTGWSITTVACLPLRSSFWQHTQ